MDIDQAVVDWYKASCLKAPDSENPLWVEISRLCEEQPIYRNPVSSLLWDLKLVQGERIPLPLKDGESLEELLDHLETVVSDELPLSLREQEELLKNLRRVPLGSGRWTRKEMARVVACLYRGLYRWNGNREPL